MNLSPLPIQKFFDNAGRPLNGGLLFTYVASTSTKLATYTDSTGGTPNTNPVVLNFRGEANVWLDQTLTYKFVLAPANDTDPPTNPIWSVDNVSAAVTYASLTAQIIGQILYPRTTAEIAAGVTPTNYTIPPYNSDRYVTNTTPGTTDVTAGIQAGYNATPDNGTYTINGGPYLISGTNALVFDKQRNLVFQGTEINYPGNGTAIQIGSTAVQQRFVTVSGAYELIRTAAIDHSGTQTAASQLLGTGVYIVNLADSFQFSNGRKRVTGFQYGYFVQGKGGGCTNGDLYGLDTQDCLIDIFLQNDSSANSFVTALNFYGVRATFNQAFYSSVVGTRNIETSRNGHTIDGNNFYGCTVESKKERKIKEDGTGQAYVSMYFDVPSGGTDIECTANSTRTLFIACEDLHLQVILDSGTLNSFEDNWFRQQQSTSGDIWYTFSGTNNIPYRTRRIGITLADNDQFQLPSNASGLVLVSCGNEGGLWHVTSAGVSTKLAGTTNTGTSGGAGLLSVFDNGDHAAVTQRLGSTLKTVIQYMHWI